MNDLASFARKLERVRADLSDDRVMVAVGVEGKKLGNRAITADAGGNLALTNWRRGRPLNLAVRFDQVGDRTVQIAPAPRSRGPVRVLTSGRQPGMSKARRGRGPRRVGATAAKGTWTEATDVMRRELPKVAAQHTTAVLAKHF
jgi:hypothetical protein